MDPSTTPSLASKRRLNAEARRGVILDAAIATLAAKGYSGCSMDEIAGAAGISKPVLYDHFTSKLDLYRAILDGIRAALMRRGGEAIRDAGSDVRSQVRAAMAVFFDFAADQPQACRILITPPVADAAAIAAFEGAQQATTAHMAQIIGRSVPTLDEARRTSFAAFIKGGMHGLALERMDAASPVDDAMLDLLSAVTQSALAAAAGPRRR